MQEVVTIRPAELEVAPTFQGSLHETPVNIYRMKVDAQSADARRMSFGWRAPGNNLLCSPQAYLEFELDCQIPYTYTEPEAVSAFYGNIDRQGGFVAPAGIGVAAMGTFADDAHINDFRAKAIQANPNRTFVPRATAAGNVININELPGGRGYRAGICFGEGDAIGNCIESIQYTINGCSISHQNWHLFKRSFDRCWVPSRVMQRVYYGCGGAWNAYDSKVTTGQLTMDVMPDALKQNDAANPPVAMRPTQHGNVCTEGRTLDSGIQKRMKNFYACIIEKNEPEKVAAEAREVTDTVSGSGFIVRIRYPLSGGLFNAVWGESGLARSCPYQRLALAIPNYNQGSMTILFKDLEKSLVRRLGRTMSYGINRGGTLINNSEVDEKTQVKVINGQVSCAQQANGYCFPFTVKLYEKTVPSIHLTYLRLQSFRRYPEVASFSTYRTQTYLGPTTQEQTFAKTPGQYIFDSGTPKYLPCNPVNGVFSKGVSLADHPGNANSSYFFDAYRPDKADKDRTGATSKIWTVEFTNLQFAQPPSYILITAQKQSECYSHKSPLRAMATSYAGYQKRAVPLAFDSGDNTQAAPGASTYTVSSSRAMGLGLDNNNNLVNAGPATLPYLTHTGCRSTKIASRYLAQNQDSSLSILRLSILVQSSVGSFKFSSDKFPYLRDQAIIWNEHKRNCNQDYFLDGTVSDWSKRQCCVLLSVSQYLHGLGSSAGVAFPIQISATVDFANQCRFICGGQAFDEKYYRGPLVVEDPIIARPVFVGLFDKQVVQVASSSAVLSAQNLSQASCTQILASRQ